MDIPRNPFKAALAEGRLQIGLWSSLCSPITTEIIAASGFDWILLDTEHSPNELPDLLVQMQAAATGTASIVVRPAWNDAVLIKRVLDIGAPTVLLPFVQDAAEAARAVAACKYPPAGMRGITGSGRASRYGRIQDYLKQADRETCVLVQIESAAALDQLEAIAGTAGVDGVFIGPADLSASMGHIGDARHPAVQAAIRDAAARYPAQQRRTTPGDDGRGSGGRVGHRQRLQAAERPVLHIEAHRGTVGARRIERRRRSTCRASVGSAPRRRARATPARCR